MWVVYYWIDRNGIRRSPNTAMGSDRVGSAHHAVAQAQQYIVQGNGWVIDLDLERFFDRVNHDRLTGQVAKRVEDKRLLKLIRAFLNAGGDGERAGQSERRTAFAAAK